MADETTPTRPRRTPARRPNPKTPATGRPGFGVVLLAILLITAPLVGVLYLGAQLLRLPFPPFDLYDWPVRSGFAPWASLATTLNTPMNGGNIAQNASLTQWLLGLSLFLALAVGVGLAFYAYTTRRGRAPDTIDGLTAGALLAVPMIFVALAAGSSTLPAPLVVIWLGIVFVAWGVALSYAFGRLIGRPAASLAGDEPVAAQPPTGMDRRRFLLQLGASTAAVTAITAAAGATLARRNEAAAVRRTLPMISPEFRAAQSELFGQFRRFAIVRGGAESAEASNVLALGAEYPDRNYVSIWLGGHSPIVIYESLETALAAYSTPDEPAGLYWLDA